MSENTKSADLFEQGLKQVELSIDVIAEQCHRALAMEAMARMIQRSPVHQFGRGGSFKGRWAAAVNASPTVHAETPDPSGRAALEAAKAVLKQLDAYSFIVLANNSPQAQVIEYGGYPKDVKRGTRIPTKTTAAGNITNAAALKRIGDDGAINIGEYEFAPRNQLSKKALKRARYIRLSQGGFSRQAPRGIVRITIEEMGQVWPAIANAVLARRGART